MGLVGQLDVEAVTEELDLGLADSAARHIERPPGRGPLSCLKNL